MLVGIFLSRPNTSLPTMQGVFITSIPKSGTHLLASLVREVTGTYPTSVKEKKNSATYDFSVFSKLPNLLGHYRISHVKGSDSLRDLFAKRKVIVLVRDPRDICNSMLHYLYSSTNLNHVAARQRLLDLDYESQIIKIAEGFRVQERDFGVPNIRNCCSGFLEIAEEFKSAHVIRYEEFFDEDSFSRVIQSIFSINKDQAIHTLCIALSGGSRTKRNDGASPNQWRSLFSDRLKTYFSNNFSDVIASLGYDV